MANEAFSRPGPDALRRAPLASAPRDQRVRLAWVGAVIAAFVLLAWQWIDTRNQLSRVREDISRRLQQADLEARESRVLARDAQDSTREVQGKLSLLEAKISESKSQQLALAQMYQELSRGRDEWLLAEVEQTLSLASQQLQLAGNVQGALLALSSADARLARSDRPQFIPLRKIINRDIERLKSVPGVDVTGLTLKLDQLASAVDSLPLLADGRPQSADTDLSGETSLWARISGMVWNEIKQLVRIQRMDAADQGLLSPEQSYFVRENLKLRLLHARLALLQRDEPDFHADLKSAESLLTRFFDTRQRAVENAVASLNQLNNAAINIELPTLAEALNAVRSVKVAGETAG